MGHLRHGPLSPFYCPSLPKRESLLGLHPRTLPISKIDQTAVRCHHRCWARADETKKKPVQTEIVEGSGASAGLVLILKPGSLSSYYGVIPNGIPNGKGWRARVYKSSKQKWDKMG
jgi:hypothetical protein